MSEPAYSNGDRVLVRNMRTVYVVEKLDKIRSRGGIFRYHLHREGDPLVTTGAYEGDMKPAPAPDLELVADTQELEAIGTIPPGEIDPRADVYEASMDEYAPGMRAEPEPEPELPQNVLSFGRTARTGRRTHPSTTYELTSVIYRARFKGFEDARTCDLPDGTPTCVSVTEELNGFAVWIAVIDGEIARNHPEEYYPKANGAREGALEHAVLLAMRQIKPYNTDIEIELASREA
jgi:hypothetical protein